MKSLVVFLYVFSFIFSATHVLAASCEQKKITRIYFGNGVGVEEDIAQATANKIEKEYGYRKGAGEEFDFDVAYNLTRGMILDVLEVFDQKIQEDPTGLTAQDMLDLMQLGTDSAALLLKEILILSGSGAGFSVAVDVMDELDDIYIDYLRDEARSDDFYRWNTINSHKSQYVYDLRNGKRVIVIAHSQGNLFANYAVKQAVAWNKERYENSIGIVGVATPANDPDVQYVTAHDDRVINALRPFYEISPSNVDNDRSVWPWKDGRDKFLSNHFFEPSYFAEGLPSRGRIDNMFGKLLSDLEFPPDKFCIMEQAFEDAYQAEGGIGVLGDMTAEGTHCWSDSGDNPVCLNGVWIRDYRKGDRETALIYNQGQEKAWLMSDVFWGYYKMIGGNEALGAPEENAYRDGDKYFQSFEHGMLEWSPTPPATGYTFPEWGITLYIDGRFISPDEEYVPPEREVVVPGISTSYGHPDMKISSVTLSKGAHSTRHHELEQDPEERFYVYAKIKNVGTARAEDFKIKFYIDGGKKNFDRDDEDYQGSVRIETFDAGAEIRFSKEITAPDEPGEYYVYACITSIDEDSDSSNNCSDEDDKDEYGKLIVEEVPTDVDLIIDELRLTHGRTSLIAGELYGLEVAIKNIGNQTPASYSYTNYAVKGPGTGDTWRQVADDGSKAEHLAPGATHWEEVSDNEEGLHIPDVPGTYTARACADYKGNVPESDEGNNCSEMTFEVEALPPGSPRIVITNPNSDDDWRSSGTDHDFRWDYYDFPERGHVRIEYSLDGGATWLLVTDSTDNDGRKYWRDMCDYHTVDTHHAFVRITSLEYPYVYDISDEFSIDHAKECE